MQRTEFKMTNQNYVTPKLGLFASIFRAPPPSMPTVHQPQMNWQSNKLQESQVGFASKPQENNLSFLYNRVQIKQEPYNSVMSFADISLASESAPFFTGRPTISL